MSICCDSCKKVGACGLIYSKSKSDSDYCIVRNETQRDKEAIASMSIKLEKAKEKGGKEMNTKGTDKNLMEAINHFDVHCMSCGRNEDGNFCEICPIRQACDLIAKWGIYINEGDNTNV